MRESNAKLVPVKTRRDTHKVTKAFAALLVVLHRFSLKFIFQPNHVQFMFKQYA